MNASRLTQLVCYSLLDKDEFAEEEVASALDRTLHPRHVPLAVVEQTLIQLRLFGFVAGEGRFRWAIPLLRDVLRSRNSEQLVSRIISELPEDWSL